MDTQWQNHIIDHGTKPADQFQANPANPRKHPQAQRRAMKGSLDDVGWIAPVIENQRTGYLIDGHERVWQALQNDNAPVPFVVVDIAPEHEAKAIAVFDQIGAMAEIDKDKLGELFETIQTDSAELGEFLEGLAAENGLVFGEQEELDDPGADIDRAEELRVKWGVETGQLWRLGEHRLICGDCTDEAVVARVMDGERADMVFTDPPYGIEYDNMKRWEGVKKQNETATRGRGAMIEGDDKEFDPSFILEYFKGCKEIFLWGMQYYLSSLGNGGVIVWNRKSEQQKDTPYADFELCWSKQPRNKMVWITWGGWKSKEKGEERLHTTQKPIELAEWFFERWSKEGDIIVDLYAGSAFSIIACEKLNRKCRAIEISPAYVAVALERWHKMTGLMPELLDES